MLSNVKELKTYTLSSPILKCGEFIDSDGKKLNIKPEALPNIYDTISNAAPIHIKDKHNGDSPIADMKKFVLQDDGIYHTSLITQNELFESRYSNGHFYVSPEIEVESDSQGNVTSAKLIGAALTNNPGMIMDKPTISIHHFEAPVDPPKSDGWQEPLGELKSTINTLNDAFKNFGEQVKNMSTSNVNSPNATEPKSTDTVTFGVDDLAKFVNEAVEKRLAEMNKPPKPSPAPTTPEASEAAVQKPPQDIPDEMAKKYAEMLSQVDALKATQEKAYKKQLTAIVNDLKSIGVEHPEKSLPDGLTTEQKITILESIKENFAKTSPLTAPLQEPLNSASPQSSKHILNVNDVLEHLECSNDPAMHRKIMMLSDSELMGKYNMNTLFDQNGNYIGPV